MKPLGLLLLFPVLVFAQEVPLEVTPVESVRMEARGNVLFADFGQDAYGTLEIEFPNDPPAGAYTVRLGEKLEASGAIDRKPPGSVSFCEIALIPHGRVCKLEVPGKPSHSNREAVKMPASIGEVTPFRYAEIEGADVTGIRLRQLAVHAPFREDASAFECSDETLNAVWKLCKQTMKATTAFGIYIDGERERIPYEADAYINLLSHYACDLDPRVARATFNRLIAYPTWPTEWSLHMPMIAEADYEATGDPVLAARHYETLKSRLLAMPTRPDGLLVASSIVDWPASERDGYNDGVVDPRQKKQVGPMVNTVANAFYFRALECMARLATALRKSDDAWMFTEKAECVHAAFNAVFFDPTRGIYIDGEGSAHASLHANMLPLAFGLVPSHRKASVASFVKSRGMACSVYGAQYLLDALFRAGDADAALALMTARAERSWWHMLKLGSTLTLEAWDASVKPNLTWNHAWGAAPANILARFVLGVRPLEPGYSRILVAPQPGTLKWMRGKVPTPLGPVEVSWQSDGGRLGIRTPAPTRVVLPCAALSAKSITVNGSLAKAAVEEGNLVIESLPAGRHTITCRPAIRP